MQPSHAWVRVLHPVRHLSGCNPACCSRSFSPQPRPCNLHNIDRCCCSDGYVTCVEVMESGDSKGRILATNIFQKQGGKWKIVHHHASPIASMI
jgi:hypothetical protein